MALALWGSYLVLGVLGLAGVFRSAWGMGAFWVAGELPVGLAAWVGVRRVPAWAVPRARVGWRPLIWGALMGWGIQVFLMGVLFVLARWHVPVTTDTQGLVRASASFSNAGAIGGFVLTTVVLAPWLEEWLFRGVLYNALITAGCSLWSTLLATAVVFGFMHVVGDPLTWPTLSIVVPIALLGLVLAWIRHRVGHLRWGMGLHAGFNALASLTLLVHGVRV